MTPQGTVPFIFKGIETDADAVDGGWRDEQTLEDPQAPIIRSPIANRTTTVTLVESEATDPD